MRTSKACYQPPPACLAMQSNRARNSSSTGSRASTQATAQAELSQNKQSPSPYLPGKQPYLPTCRKLYLPAGTTSFSLPCRSCLTWDQNCCTNLSFWMFYFPWQHLGFPLTGNPTCLPEQLPALLALPLLPDAACNGRSADTKYQWILASYVLARTNSSVQYCAAQYKLTHGCESISPNVAFDKQAITWRCVDAFNHDRCTCNIIISAPPQYWGNILQKFRKDRVWRLEGL